MNAEKSSLMNSKNSLFFINKKKSINIDKIKSTKEVSQIKNNDKLPIHPKQSAMLKKRNSTHEYTSLKRNVFTNPSIGINKILNKKKSMPENNFMRFDTMNKGDLVKLIIEQEVFINSLQVR